jgi:6-phosphogluconolactonase
MKNEDHFPAVFDLLVGCYTADNNEGIKVYRFATGDGQLTYLNGIEGIADASYLCITANNRFVYCVNEHSYDRPGGVSALSYEPESGKLKLINQQPTDSCPCYISIDKAQKYAFVANYASGSLTVYPLAENGSLLPAIQQIQNEGDGPDPERQEKPHVHAAVLSPDEGQVLFTDLGTDQVHIYNYKPTETPPISPAGASLLKVVPGHGPRHIVFSPDKKFMYLITEMGGSVYVYNYEDLQPRRLQVISLSAEDFNGALGGGDLQVSPDGKFLYASNRGDANEIVVFAISPATGALAFIERISCMGKSPRNMAIDPSGNFLLVANENSNDIYVYRINKQKGQLTLTGSRTSISSPCCLKFITVP